MGTHKNRDRNRKIDRQTRKHKDRSEKLEI